MSTYERSGVQDQGEALSSVARHLGPTFSFASGAQVLTGFGHYASVIRLTDELALAICTDGVGSKTLIASALDRYDTIGFDCMAMNVNDVICIGARPLALVDYLGVHTLDERRVDEILKGLGAAAKEAGVAIPGGELAQLPEVIGSDGRVSGDPTAFDLVGTCVGTLHPDEVILGRAVRPGDAILSVASSGIHSNGLTLARRVLLRDGPYELDDEVAELGRSVGEELLEPTEIYVRAALDLWDAGIATHGISHITGDGLLNLSRLEAEIDYRIEALPQPQPIFDLIARTGAIDDAEMYRVFNMGIGLVVIVEEGAGDTALARMNAGGYRAHRIGTVTDGSGRVHLIEKQLVGHLASGKGGFERS